MLLFVCDEPFQVPQNSLSGKKRTDENGIAGIGWTKNTLTKYNKLHVPRCNANVLWKETCKIQMHINAKPFHAMFCAGLKYPEWTLCKNVWFLLVNFFTLAIKCLIYVDNSKYWQTTITSYIYIDKAQVEDKKVMPILSLQATIYRPLIIRIINAMIQECFQQKATSVLKKCRIPYFQSRNNVNWEFRYQQFANA